MSKSDFTNARENKKGSWKKTKNKIGRKQTSQPHTHQKKHSVYGSKTRDTIITYTTESISSSAASITHLPYNNNRNEDFTNCLTSGDTLPPI